MNTSEQELEDDTTFTESSLILLSGDNPHSARLLGEMLQDHGFNIQFAQDLSEVETLWHRQRVRSPVPVMVLLEVTESRHIEAAVDTALQLKRHDPYQFVGYLADPVLWTGGLIGDAIFPRSPRQLGDALKSYFNPSN